MKIRIGFVSNSSSSSSIILGKGISFDEVLDRKSNTPVFMLGDYVNEGMDFFEITPEILAQMKAIRWSVDNFQFIEVYRICEDGESIDKNKLPNKFQIFSFDQDYHNTETPADFKERYQHNDDDQ